jgi:hypothetical protein
MFLNADETPSFENLTSKEASTTYVQKYSGFSITLPESWHIIVNEYDKKDWSEAHGLYYYHPAPGEHPGISEWAHIEKSNPKDVQSYLSIQFEKRPPDLSTRYCNDFLYHRLQGYKMTIHDKGESNIQGKKCKWYLTTDPTGVHCYALSLINGQAVYFIMFHSVTMTPEHRAYFDQILSTFTFLK